MCSDQRNTQLAKFVAFLTSLALCFLSSVARAAEPADTPASIKVRVLSGEVTDILKAAVLSVARLVAKRSAGWVWLWSRMRSLPASHLDKMMSSPA